MKQILWLMIVIVALPLCSFASDKNEEALSSSSTSLKAGMDVDLLGRNSEGKYFFCGDSLYAHINIFNNGEEDYTSNPESRCCIGVHLYKQDFSETSRVWSEGFSVTIVSGEDTALDFVIPSELIEEESEYHLFLTNIDKGLTSSIGDTITFKVSHDPSVWNSEGTVSFLSVEEDGIYHVPSWAASVALYHTDISKVDFSTANDNCIFFLPKEKSISSALLQRNVVFGRECPSLSLTDDNGYFSAANFIADYASYMRTPDGEKQWESLALPFDVQNILAYDINSYQSELVTVEELIEVEGEKLVFSPSNVDLYLSCNKPYIIHTEVPGSRIQFSSENVRINITKELCCSIKGVNFRGIFSNVQAASDLLSMNDNGTAFVANKPIESFRGFITTDSSVQGLSIVTDDSNGIKGLDSKPSDEIKEVFSLDGTPVYKGISMPNLSKGLYIVKDGGKTMKFTKR